VPPSLTIAVAAQLWLAERDANSSATIRRTRDRMRLTSNAFRKLGEF
jgi:hypothetical protein